MKQLIERGKFLLQEYRRLDDYIVNQRYAEGGNSFAVSENYKTAVRDLDAFNTAVKEFIDDTDSIANGKLLYQKNRQHEQINDAEEGAPLLRDFYTNGITLEQIMLIIEKQITGTTLKRKFDNKFHFIKPERILYRNSVEMTIHSHRMMRFTLLEVAFDAKKDEWVTADEIEERRISKIGYDESPKDPFYWISNTCKKLNDDTKKQFNINYKLFEMEEGKIRLNPKAR